MSYFFSKTTTLFDDLTVLSNFTNDNRQPYVRTQLDTVKTDIVSRLQKHAAVYKERKMVIKLNDIFQVDAIPTTVGLSFSSAMCGTSPMMPTKVELKWFADSLINFFKTEGITASYIDETLTIDWSKRDNLSGDIKESVVMSSEPLIDQPMKAKR